MKLFTSIWCSLKLNSYPLTMFFGLISHLFVSQLLLHASYRVVRSQSFDGCDIQKELKPGTVYTLVSPNYRKPYTPGTFCRYSVYATPGNQIVLRCNELIMPITDRCSGDRLQISRNGNLNLADSERYCSGPFETRSFAERMVIALLSPAQGPGGMYKCDFYAVPGCDCGRRKQIRIVGGTETNINEFPSMAGLVSKRGTEPFCGATIIDTNYAITAAHCMIFRANEIDLLVGDHDFTNPSESPYTRRYEISSIIRHPNYSDTNDTNDIAVITLRRPIVFNAGVGAVCLPFKYQYANFLGWRAEALGWGTIEFGGPTSSRLLKVQLDVVNQSRCENAYPHSFTSSQVCTYTRRKDTCSQDSGGPLMISDTSNNNLLYQIGITSFGMHCASSTPSVSTRITSYLDWIERVTPLANYCIQ